MTSLRLSILYDWWPASDRSPAVCPAEWWTWRGKMKVSPSARTSRGSSAPRRMRTASRVWMGDPAEIVGLRPWPLCRHPLRPLLGNLRGHRPQSPIWTVQPERLHWPRPGDWSSSRHFLSSKLNIPQTPTLPDWSEWFSLSTWTVQGSEVIKSHNWRFSLSTLSSLQTSGVFSDWPRQISLCFSQELQWKSDGESKSKLKSAHF